MTGNNFHIKAIFPFFLFWCLPFLMAAQESEEKEFLVGVAGEAPFVTGEHNEQGISLEVWEEIAMETGLEYKIISFDNIPDALNALQAGKIDIVVGPTSITAERSKYVVFSQPYFQSDLAILSRIKDPSFWDRIGPFFNAHFFIAIGTFVFILGVVGTFLWLAERRQNPDEFPKRPLNGIGNGMWCAIVTMTTTGYGDVAPKTLAGRVVAGSWMVISLIFAASMIAGISSTLTLTGMGSTTINTAKELYGKKVAVVPGSPSANLVEKYGGISIGIDSLEQASAMLKSKSVDAVVYDRPQLKNFLNNNPHNDFNLSTAGYMQRGYGFAFAEDLEIIADLNTAILAMKESGQITHIAKSWLGISAAEQ